MTYTVSVTSQGQISIPILFRREMGLDKGGKVILSKEFGKLIIEPVGDFLTLKGSLKTNKKPLSNLELDEFISKAAAEEYAQKFK